MYKLLFDSLQYELLYHECRWEFFSSKHPPETFIGIGLDGIFEGVSAKSNPQP